MRKLGLYRGENFVFFKEFEFDLSAKGISHIRGINNNSSIKGRNNGSGKSLFASGIDELLLNTNAMKTSTAFKTSDQLQAGTLLEIELDDSLIRKSGTKTTPAYEIFDEKRKPLGNKLTLTKSMEIIDSLYGLNEAEHFSTVHLDSRRPFLLQTGRPEQRLEFMSNLFRLDDFDLMAEYFKDRLDSIKSDIAVHKELVEQLDKLKKSVTSIDDMVVEVEAESQRLKERLSYLRKVEGSSSNPSNLSKKSRLKEILVKLGTTADKKGAKELSSRIGELKKECNEVLLQWDAYSSWKKQYDKYSTEIESVKGIDADPDAVKKQLNKTRKQLEEARQNMAVLRDKKEKYLSQQKLLKAHKTTIDSLPYPELPLMSRISNYLLTNGKNFKKSVLEALRVSEHQCFVCSAELSKQKRAALLAEYSEEKELDVKALMSIGEEITFSDKKYSKKAAELESLEKEVSRLTKVDTGLTRCQEIGEEPTKPEQSSEYMKEMLLLVLEASNLLPDVDWSEGEAVDVKQYEKYMAWCTRAQESLPLKRAEIENQKRIGKDIERLEKKIDDLKSVIEKSNVYTLLYQAYGTRGIKSLAISKICNSVIGTVNTFSKLCLPEPMEFSCEITPGQFDIIAHRPKERESDVRRLSGGESLAFNLLMAASIITHLPANRRTNVMLLDEMAAHIDEASTPLMYDTFIPFLQTIVPHVIVLDLGGHEIHDATRYNIIKEGGVSRLEKEK